MHEHSVEAIGKTDGQGAVRGRVPRTAAGHALAEGGQLYGKPVAHPVGHSPGEPAQKNEAAADVGCVRETGCGHRRAEGQASEREPLAVLGEPESCDAETLCPKEQSVVAAGTPVTTTTVLGLLEEQSYRCALTGRPLTPKTAALDHILSIQRGGEHSIENTQVLHYDVNRAKGTMTNEEFVGLCEEVVIARRRKVGDS